jgi:glycine hydroxymethyltransferase
MSICFEEALSPNFKKYAQQIIANSQALANTLLKNKIKLIGGGTQNHLMLVDLRPFKITGQIASWKLSLNNIITNKNLIPFDLLPPDQTSGVRLGTPAVTTRGMKEKEMVQIGQWVAEILYGKASDDLPKKIKQFAMKFPLPGKVLNSK